MASTSESSFGKRLDNAKSLETHILSFSNYIEINTELTKASLNTKINDLLLINGEIANYLQAYSMGVDIKQKLFTKEDNSILKLITVIAANVRSVYGKNSKESTNVANLINKIRGIKVTKPKNSTDADTISRSERSYGTVLQTFSDLIVVLESFGTAYNPTNVECTVSSLRNKLALAAQTSTLSVQDYGKLKIARDSRTTQYEQLASFCQRLKDSVRAQYGTKSVEYKLVRSLRI